MIEAFTLGAALVSNVMALIAWHHTMKERDIARAALDLARHDIEDLARQNEGLRYLRRRDSRGRFLGLIEEATT